MEQEKTIDEIKAENAVLSQQLQDMNEKVKSLGTLLLSAKENNVKLAYSTRLFAEVHLTRDEKIAIAQELHKAVNAEQVEKIYEKYMEQLVPPDTDAEPGFTCSPGFIRDLEKYYLHYKGYNPFEIIENSIKVIRAQFRIEDELKITTDTEKIKVLREAWQNSREASAAAVNEILAITNEILQK
jgi:hypothetical protein